MEFPDLCVPYMAKDAGLASAAILCRPAWLERGRP
jgi:hypothetical protein